MKNCLIALFTVTALIIAFLYPTLSVSLSNTGILNTVSPPTSTNCTKLMDELLTGCIDGALNGNNIYYACSLPRSHSKIISFDTVTRKTVALQFIDRIPPQIVAMSLYNDRSASACYFAIISKGESTVVELYSLPLGSFTLLFVRSMTVQADLNGIALVSPVKYYSASPFNGDASWKSYLSSAFRLKSGAIYFYDGELTTEVMDGVIYPKGLLVVSGNLLVTSYTNRALSIYEIKDNDGLRLTDTVSDLRLIPERVSYDGDSYLIAGHSNLFQLRAFTHELLNGSPLTKISPSLVVRISSNEGKDVFYGKKFNENIAHSNGNGLISGAHTAIRVHHELFISGLSGLAICPA